MQTEHQRLAYSTNQYKLLELDHKQRNERGVRALENQARSTNKLVLSILPITQKAVNHGYH